MRTFRFLVMIAIGILLVGCTTVTEQVLETVIVTQEPVEVIKTVIVQEPEQDADSLVIEGPAEPQEVSSNTPPWRHGNELRLALLTDISGNDIADFFSLDGRYRYDILTASNIPTTMDEMYDLIIVWDHNELDGFDMNFWKEWLAMGGVAWIVTDGRSDNIRRETFGYPMYLHNFDFNSHCHTWSYKIRTPNHPIYNGFQVSTISTAKIRPTYGCDDLTQLIAPVELNYQWNILMTLGNDQYDIPALIEAPYGNGLSVMSIIDFWPYGTQPETTHLIDNIVTYLINFITNGERYETNRTLSVEGEHVINLSTAINALPDVSELPFSMQIFASYEYSNQDKVENDGGETTLFELEQEGRETSYIKVFDSDYRCTTTDMDRLIIQPIIYRSSNFARDRWNLYRQEAQGSNYIDVGEEGYIVFRNTYWGGEDDPCPDVNDYTESEMMFYRYNTIIVIRTFFPQGSYSQNEIANYSQSIGQQIDQRLTGSLVGGGNINVSEEDIQQVIELQNQYENGEINNEQVEARLEDIATRIGHDGLVWILTNLPIYDSDTSSWIMLDDYLDTLSSGSTPGSTSRIEQDPIGTGVDLFIGDYTTEDLLNWVGLTP